MFFWYRPFAFLLWRRNTRSGRRSCDVWHVSSCLFPILIQLVSFHAQSRNKQKLWSMYFNIHSRVPTNFPSSILSSKVWFFPFVVSKFFSLAETIFKFSQRKEKNISPKIQLSTNVFPVNNSFNSSFSRNWTKSSPELVELNVTNNKVPKASSFRLLF